MDTQIFTFQSFPTNMVAASQSPYLEGAHKLFREFFKSLKGFMHAYICTHMNISVIFPTDMGVLHKAPIKMGLCKAPTGFMKPITLGLCKATRDLRPLQKPLYRKLIFTWGLVHTCIFQYFLLQIQECFTKLL